MSDAPGSEPGGQAPTPRQDGLASVVLIDRRDDVAAVCGRIDSAPTFAVVIHAPDGNRQAATQLGMRRLVRHAEESGRIIAIATRSRALAARARQAGVPTGRRPERIRWDSGGRRVLWLGPTSIVLPAIGRYFQFVMLAAVVVVALALVFTLAPSADVVVSPPLEEVTLNVTLTGSQERVDTDLETLEVPAREVQTTRHVTLAKTTTGTADVPVTRATVLVSLANTGDEDIVVPLNAVLVAPGNIEFVIDQETTVPAGKTVLQQASASEPGPGGNIPAGTLTSWRDDRFDAIQVTNAEAATGGATEQRPAVSADDVAALQTLAASLQTSDEIRSAIVEDREDAGIFFRSIAIEVVPGRAYPAVGEPGTVVFLEVDLVITALAVPSESLEALANHLMGPDASGVMVPGSVTAVETGRRQVNGSGGELTSEFTLNAGFSSVSEDDIKDAVKGRSPGDAEASLEERYAIEDADVDLVPGFMPWLPRFDFRIDVVFQAEQATPTVTPTPTADDTSTAESSPESTQTPGP